MQKLDNDDVPEINSDEDEVEECDIGDEDGFSSD